VFVRQRAKNPQNVNKHSNNNLRKNDERLIHAENFKYLTTKQSIFRHSNKSLFEIAPNYNVRSISPRNMANLSFDLYTSDCINRKQYLDLSYQVDLSPKYNKTIGALIGENAAPDKPKDYIVIWHKRLLFEQNYFGHDLGMRHHVKSILSILSTLEEIAQLMNRLRETKSGKVHTITPKLPPLSLRRMEY